MTRVFQTLAITVALAILVLSLQPFSGPVSQTHADKVHHFLAYGVLSGLIALGWPRLKLIGVIMIASLFGLGIEGAQGLLSESRTASSLDALANLAGAACVAFAIFLIRKMMAKTS